MDEATIRHDWTLAEVRAIHDSPLTELVYRAQTVHRDYHRPDKVQLCTLLSIKTGGCPENCGYCPQSAHFDAGVEREKLMGLDVVLEAAHRAKEAGAARFCMGAAWRELREGDDFDNVCAMIRGVTDLGLEACVTLGMVTKDQALRLKEAGLDTYNHNLDTSRDFYPEIVTTRTYEDRLDTLRNVREAGIELCTGGIIGMGESIDDRCGMLIELANLDEHPENVPVNALVPVEGTPLADTPPIKPFELVRMIATARILMPEATVRLSAGRTSLSDEAQMLCFLAGANSMFYGDKLLTTGNPESNEDLAMMREMGLTPVEIAEPDEAASSAA